ncbi:pentatricopeptide repeat-containing protein At4g32430, mitochondrial [Macadamia integrifolia]|uniref:pentatricopeptide repeat-containing protein At4g32430, mitochondrial n=1 Tax=Macadamia integrifolia TaxID=60698 RepID=UPI001C4EA738|nr:pentatricopeptide repeat-containing protein At4g32430, mitochondrial [Macadamia integrifolia]
MFTRQRDFKSILTIAKQRSTNLKSQRSYRNAHHLFNRNPRPNVGFNNHAMFACFSRNRPLEALKIFGEQLQLGLIGTINEVTLALALKACRGDTKPGSQIHGFAISSGLDSFLTVSNSLMNMYCKSGQFDQAFVIFQNLHDTDVVSWNTILSGFHQSQDAIRFALQMHLSGVFFDAVTYTTVLAFCSDIQECLLGSQFHSHILKSGFCSEIFVGNALITMYSRPGNLEEAKRIFDEMPERDLVSWNALLSGYTQGVNYGIEAISVFTKMVKGGMELDHVSFASVVSACGHERSLEVGRQIHGLIIRTGYGTDVSVCNVLISMYAKCEIPEDAKIVFEEMIERNVVSWTTIVSVSEKDAFSLFNMMRQDEVYPNDVTFVGLIHVVSTNNLAKEGEMIHGFCIKTGFLSELNVSNSFITMYSKFESMEESKRVFDEQTYREIISWNALISGYAQNRMYVEAFQTYLLAIQESHPNQFTFGSVLSAIGAAEPLSLRHGQRCHSSIIKLGLNTDPIVSGALLDMYAKRGNINESQRVFNEAPERSNVAWTAIISAHACHGDYKSVMSLFKQMERERVPPDSITFLSVLTACSRSGMVETGCRVFQSMIKDHSIEPSPEHYSCVVDMLGRAGRLEEAEEFVNQMPIKPGLSVWQSLLGACRIHGNVEMGKRAAEALVEMEPMESGSYVLICNLYAEKGEWDKVAKIRKGMRQRGVKKEVGFSWVDVGDGSMRMHGFSSGDKSHPQVEEICKMAECIGLEMRFLEKQRLKESDKKGES